jgi:hypothetical protein
MGENIMINKKGAMFGLDCRALKKQFGKLFLASRQSDAPLGANGSCGYVKRGAMFGLDARIALAIFGALSVISGAALYSAIQEAKIVAFYTDLREFEKAIESYVVDTGDSDMLGSYGEMDYLYEAEKRDVALSVWNGPYLPSVKKPLLSYYFHHPRFDMMRLAWRPDASDTYGCDVQVLLGVKAHYYALVDDKKDETICNGSESFLKAVHDKYDSDGDYEHGKIKVVEHFSNTGQFGLFYRIDTLKENY